MGIGVLNGLLCELQSVRHRWLLVSRLGPHNVDRLRRARYHILWSGCVEATTSKNSPRGAQVTSTLELAGHRLRHDEPELLIHF